MNGICQTVAESQTRKYCGTTAAHKIIVLSLSFTSMKGAFFVIFLLSLFCAQAQDYTNLKQMRIPAQDTLALAAKSIAPVQFSLKTLDGEEVDTSFYHIDFEESRLILKPEFYQNHDSLQVSFMRYPEFLSASSQLLDPEKVIVPNTVGTKENMVDLQLQKPEAQLKQPFRGLHTSGNISRGLVVGNNQNAVVQSELDLQISGRLSDDLKIRASIRDANLPSQSGGYTQNLNEFDQIFIELESKNWAIRAGDVDLENHNTLFANYSKRVQGLKLDVNFGDSLSRNSVFGAAAIVRGVFKRSEVQAQEGNQGPYKLTGNQGEQYILIISGSESVFVNGRRLKRGENEDYIIDYNAGEIIFNPNYPINSSMRISVEYQVSEQNYSRIIATAGGAVETEKFSLKALVYNENDLKNQPLQQSLTEEQVETLSEAGDDESKMFAPSAVPTAYSENRILYKKTMQDGVEIYEFSNNPDDELFGVRFTNVGENQGDYIVSSQEAVTTIFEYVSPINGESQGNFEPFVRLIPPTKLQLANISGHYQPRKGTDIDFEFAASLHDQNLFSSLDGEDNNGFAAQVGVRQKVFQSKDKHKKLTLFGSFNFLQDDYKSIERIYNVEFERDWNLRNTEGDQNYITVGAEFADGSRHFNEYRFEKLDYSHFYNGQKHAFQSRNRFGKFLVRSHASVMQSDSEINETDFVRAKVDAEYDFSKVWTGVGVELEQNEDYLKSENSYTAQTQHFIAYDAYVGVGDSTAVFAKVGFQQRMNDSLRNDKLQRVNTSQSLYVDSKLVDNKNSQLTFFGSWRTLNFEAENREDETTINGRIRYQQSLFNRVLNLTTTYETHSGNVARQEYTYVEVEPGQGQFTWNDYNGNGIQELDEFEVAQFQDEASYIRVLLPHQVYVRTNQNRLSQQVVLDFRQYAAKEGFKKFMSHFYNQTSVTIDQKTERDGSQLDFNPFQQNSNNVIGQNNSFRNILFYNRGQKDLSTSYTYSKSETKNLLVVGLQSLQNTLHELQFKHEFNSLYLLTLQQKFTTSESDSENFANRNYSLSGFSSKPTFSYLPGKNKKFDLFYAYAENDNSTGELASLQQHEFGLSLSLNNDEKYTITAETKYIKNKFEGNSQSAVAYQMLEGLQPDDNFTWSVFLQKRISQFLDLNVTYLGRKTADRKAIHTGSVQLRAFF